MTDVLETIIMSRFSLSICFTSLLCFEMVTCFLFNMAARQLSFINTFFHICFYILSIYDGSFSIEGRGTLVFINQDKKI